jgi:LuxR family maltose regulon positive regulatory protein
VAKPSTAIAKLSRPKLLGVLARERLFARLDAERTHPAVWISAPPGAGKTSLVASYLRSRKLPGVWYQVDSGDAELASLFHYLAVAAPKPGGSRRESLRTLSAEHLADLPAFTRRFFRTYFARLPATAVVVLDNFQEAGSSDAFHAVFRDALNEVRDGLTLIVISRTDPPAPFVHALANGLIGRIGWDEIKLTADEMRSIIDGERAFDDATVRALQEQSGGWAAGLLLMLQHVKATGNVQPSLQQETMEGVFTYFAGQVFEQVTPLMRDILLRTAFLPRVTEAAAISLTGHPDAATALEQLYRQRLFTDRHSGATLSYQYHALFGEFLRVRAAAELTPAQLRELKSRSAELLEATPDAAIALQLYVANEDWAAATTLILKRARALIAEGRWLTFRAWVALLPKEHVAQMPALMLWLGSSQILVDPVRARTILQRAFEQMRAINDVHGQMLAVTGIVETHNIEFSSSAALDPWIDVLEGLLRSAPAFRSVGERLRINAAMVLATMLRRPAHPMLAVCLAEVRAILAGELPNATRADVATQLLEYYTFTGDLRSAAALVDATAPFVERDDLSPFRRAGWLVFFSYYASLIGDLRAGIAALDRLRAIVREFGMTWFDFLDLFFRALLHLLGPAPLTATPFVQQLGAKLDERRSADRTQYHLARVLLYQARGETSLAIYHGELCVAAGRESGVAVLNILFMAVVASAYIEAGQFALATELLADARRLGDGTVYRPHEALILMTEAYAGWMQHDLPRALEALRRALLRGIDDQTAASFRWLVVGFRRMLALALEHDIEADLARGLIERFGVTAESADVAHWPWPIRIRTLGGFALLIDGAPMPPQRKQQKKPLDLLKLLAAHAGRDVSAAAAAQALWPDAEGDAAATVFEVTLRRLRKLLGREDAIALSDGRLTLNARICWIDTSAFDRAQKHIGTLLGAQPEAVDRQQLERVAATAFDLYRGPFLDGDDERPWLLACRQQLAGQFLRQLAGIGQFWEQAGEPDSAERCYRRGLEIDPLAEALYRRLMALQSRRGRRADALDTYRQCRTMLAASMGIEPSGETEAARRAVLDRP